MAMISKENVKVLVPVADKAIRSFANKATFLYGLIARREQLDAGSSIAFSAIEEDLSSMKQKIKRYADMTYTELKRLNTIAQKKGFSVCSDEVFELNLSDFVSEIVKYVEALVAESDFRQWLEEEEE